MVSRRDGLSAWAFLLPMLALFILFVVVPLLTALGLSFFSWRFLNTPTWVGLDNFARLLTDRSLLPSILVTCLFVAMGVLPTILIGFCLAVLVNVKLPGIAFLRMFYFVPIVVSVSVNAVLWRFIYDTRRGPLGAIARVLGWDIPSVLDTTRWALPGLVLIMIWAGLPLVIILYLAALQRISEDLYAAASLDGAGSWRMMWSISWPNVASTTWLLLVLIIVFFSAGSLDFARATTNGGPLDATTSLGLYAFKTAFERLDVGYSSVLSLVQMVVIVGVAGLLLLGARLRRA